MINSVTLLGRLGTDPNLKYTASSKAVCDFTLATSKAFKDKNGNKQETTAWHKIVVWGKNAENCADFLSKGKQAYIEGEIQYRDYEDKQGVKRYATEINASRIVFLDKPETQSTEPSITTEELPF